MKRLENKIALITGGGSGIGRGIALAIAQEGANIVVCGRRKQKLDETISLVRELNVEGLAIQADISIDLDVQRVVQQTLNHFGQIDILINNAGVFMGKQVYQTEPDDWDKVMAINLRGVFLLTRRVLPYMRERRSGHIINISSESGMDYYDGDGVYGTSKHALNAFNEYVQRENQDFNIRVNAICPGMVVTEMTENDQGLIHDRCLYPEDIADLVIWLVTRRQNIKIGTPILFQTMLNPWENG
jgi:NADP-dependent 3-hydroxy acid dehydrogenase YdfG